MKRNGVIGAGGRMRVLAFGMASLAASLAFAPAAAHGASKRKAAASAKKTGSAPVASAEEINKLKGDFKWGMTPDDVRTKVAERLQASYEPRLTKSANDPARHDRVRKEMRADLEKAKKNYVEFKGQKSGWDVSIIDREFAQNTGESMLFAKEENATRYFFFDQGRLYKMFIAFDKEMLQGKSFEEFGELMQARFGKARAVTIEEPTKAGTQKKLDHFEWSSKSGDGLRLVDRSEFYDVFCLVLFDGAVATRLADARKAANPGGPRTDGLIEAVTTAPANERDPNDNVIDRITGREHKKPGEGAPANIVVPSPTPAAKAATPAEVNRKDEAESVPATEKKAGKASKGKLKDGRSPETEGLAL